MNQEKIVKELVKFGITNAQAKLYFAGLCLRRALMAQLARTAGIKRTTAYYLMKELERRGFFRHKKIGKRTHYFAATPERLLAMTLEREKMVSRLLPHLKTISS